MNLEGGACAEALSLETFGKEKSGKRAWAIDAEGESSPLEIRIALCRHRREIGKSPVLVRRSHRGSPLLVVVLGAPARLGLVDQAKKDDVLRKLRANFFGQASFHVSLHSMSCDCSEDFGKPVVATDLCAGALNVGRKKADTSGSMLLRSHGPSAPYLSTLLRGLGAPTYSSPPCKEPRAFFLATAFFAPGGN
jgi:hypothetical protein